MKHDVTARFWAAYSALLEEIRDLADKSYKLWATDPFHPSLHFKKVGRFWSARFGLNYRALAMEVDDGLLWFWIGPHDEYQRMIRK